MLVSLFTDIEGSSQLWEEHTGDGITAVFDAGQPLACALEAQVRKNLLWAATQRRPGMQRTRLEFAAS